MKKRIVSIIVALSVLVIQFGSIIQSYADGEVVTTIDGGFENKSWNGQNTSYGSTDVIYATEDNHSGAYSYRIDGTVWHAFSDTPVSTWSPDPSKNYYLSFWAKATEDFGGKVVPKVQFRLAAGGGGATSLDLTASDTANGINPGTEWVEYRYNVTYLLRNFDNSISALRIGIWTTGYTGGSLYLDDFKFVEGTCSDGKQVKASTTIDGGFENKKWTGQNTSYAIVPLNYDTSVRHGGLQSYKVDGTVWLAFSDTSVDIWKPEADKKYYLSYWAKATEDFGGKVVPKVSFRLAAGGGGASSLDLTAADTANGINVENKWVEYRYDVTGLFKNIDNTVSGIRITVTTTGYTAGALYLDDFKFVEGTCTDGKQEGTGEDTEASTTADGGFENKLWNGQNTSYAIIPLKYDTSEKHSGSQSYKVDGTVWLAFSDTSVDVWKPEVEKKYYLSYWAKESSDFVGKVVPKVSFRLAAGGGGATTLDLTAADTANGINVGTEWVEYRYDVTGLFKNIDSTVSGIRITITTTGYTGGALYLDDFKFVEGTCTDGKQNNSGVSKDTTTLDGSFEKKLWNGQNTSYASVPLKYDNVEKCEGSLSYKVDGTVWLAFSDTSVDVWKPEADKKYYLSYWAKATEDFGGKVVPKVSFRLAAGGGGASSLDLTAADTANGLSVGSNWVEYRYDVTDLFKNIDNTVSGIRITITTTGYSAGALYLDDFKFVEGSCTNGQVIISPDSLTNINNGGFENGNWLFEESQNLTVAPVTDEKYKGDSSLKITATSTNEGRATLDTITNQSAVTFMPEQGKDYYLSVWAKASSDADMRIVFKMAQRVPDGQGGMRWNYMTIKNSPSTSDMSITLGIDSPIAMEWTEYQIPLSKFLSGSAISNDQILTQLLVRNAKSGTVWIDNIKIIEGKTQYENSNNQLGMDSFETGIFFIEHKGTGCSATWTSKESHTGNYSMAFSGNSKDPDQKVFSNAVLNNVDTSKRHRATVWIKSKGASETSIYMRIMGRKKISDTKTETGWIKKYGTENLVATGGTQDWTKYSVDLSDFGGYETFVFYLYLYGPGEVWFDDVVFEEAQNSDVVADGTVSADVESGKVNPMQEVYLYTGSDNADIYYTTDGTDPRTSETGVLFTDYQPIVITKDTTVKAYVTGEGIKGGEVKTYTYTCDSPIVNNSFEKGVWTANTNSTYAEIDTVNVKHGKKSLKLEGNMLSQTVKSNNIVVDSRGDITISFWMKSKDLVFPESAGLGIYGTYAHGRSYYYLDKYQVTPASTQDWKKYTVVIPGGSGSLASLEIHLSIGNTQGTVWFDDVQLSVSQPRNNAIKVENGGSNSFGNMSTVSTADQNFTVSESFKFTNSSYSEQVVKLNAVVTNESGEVISEETVDFGMGPQQSTARTFEFTAIATYGVFKIHFMVDDGVRKYEAGVIPISRTKASGISDTAESLFSLSTHQGHFLEGCEEKIMKQIASSGCGWIRADHAWPNVETAKGVYENAANKLAQSANANGLKLLLVLGKANSFYDQGKFPTSDEAVSAFAKYCGEVAKANKGKVQAYEIWNEYDNESDGNSLTQKGKNYAKILKAAYAAIKAEDPGVTVIAGVATGINYNYIRAILENKTINYMDAVSVHPYCNDYTEYFSSPETDGIVNKVQELKKMIKSYGRDLPIWATEINWPTSVTYKGVKEKVQANYLQRTILLNEEYNLFKNIFFYDYMDDGENEFYNEHRFGVTAYKGSVVPYAPKSSFVALTGLSAILSDCKFNKAIKSPADNIKISEFVNSKNGNLTYAVWSDDKDVNLKFNFSKSGIKLLDMYGNYRYIDSDAESVGLAIGGFVQFLTAKKGTKLKSVELIGSLEKEKKKENSKYDVVVPDSTNGESIQNAVTVTDASVETTEPEVTKIKEYVKRKVKKPGSSSAVDDKNIGVIVAVIAAVIVALAATAVILFYRRKKKKS